MEVFCQFFLQSLSSKHALRLFIPKMFNHYQGNKRSTEEKGFFVTDIFFSNQDSIWPRTQLSKVKVAVSLLFRY